MNLTKRMFVLAAALVLFGSGSARAGAVIPISETAKIDLGFRLQTLYLASEEDLDGDGSFESTQDFRVRRARLRLGATITEEISLFLQTEMAEDAGGGADMRLIDAFVTWRHSEAIQLIAGENMAPVTRQNLTSSGALLAADRPGIAYKNLTWGTRALAAFATRTYGDSDAGLRGSVDVRDTGLTLFGTRSLQEQLHFKYYLGAYDGVQETDEDGNRYAARLQVNFGEAEKGYYNSSTYLGGKKTLAVGAAFDTQSDVAEDALLGGIDYAMGTLDIFAEHPLGPGSLSAEAAYLHLDLDGASQLDANGNGDFDRDARQSEGDGFYVQAGYFLHNWQPWLAYERWESEAADDRGSFDALRAGLSYFFKGQHANLKLGYERFEAEQLIGNSDEKTIHTLLAGIYLNY